MKRYPMLSNWVTIKDYRFGNATITNELTDKVYYTDPSHLTFLRMLDGKTDPYTLPYPHLMGWSLFEINAMLSEFRAFGIIRESMVFEKSFASLYRTVFIPSRKHSDSVLFKLLNIFMWVFFLPVLVWGAISFWSEFTTVGFDDISLWGILGGILTGLLLGGAFHECGHVISTLATGGEVFEMGVALHFPIFPGAYAATKEDDSATPIQKAQVSAAGMEVNLILVGLALIILAYCHRGAGFLISFALTNLLLVFDNLLLFRGIDGCWVYSHLFGLDACITDVALNMLFTKEKRKRLMEGGCHGKACLLTYSLIILLYVAGIAFLLLSIVNLINAIIS